MVTSKAARSVQNNKTTISFIGFGEAGQAFASGLSEDGRVAGMRAFDIKTNGPDAQSKRMDYQRHAVAGANRCADVCKDTDVIFSLVTAEQANAAAEEAARTPLEGAFFLDCNSCAPDTKKHSANRIEAAGGRYVDVAIMTPVHPKRHKSPCLLAGPHAEAAHALMAGMGMDVQVAGKEIGTASARKMIRSVMVKGLEALTLECFLAARKYGIEKDIMASLDKSYPGFGWPERATYMFERAMTHGVRRAAEMREVEKTLRDVGIEPHMTSGTVSRQSQVGALELDATKIGKDEIAALADAILNRLNAEQTQ